MDRIAMSYVSDVSETGSVKCAQDVQNPIRLLDRNVLFDLRQPWHIITHNFTR